MKSSPVFSWAMLSVLLANGLVSGVRRAEVDDEVDENQNATHGVADDHLLVEIRRAEVDEDQNATHGVTDEILLAETMWGKMKGAYGGKFNLLFLQTAIEFNKMMKGGWPPKFNDVLVFSTVTVARITAVVFPLWGAAFALVSSFFHLGGKQQNDMTTKILEEASKITDKAILESTSRTLSAELYDLMKVLERGPEPAIYKTDEEKCVWKNERAIGVQLKMSTAFYTCLGSSQPAWDPCMDQWKSISGGGSALLFELAFAQEYLALAVEQSMCGFSDTFYHMMGDFHEMVLTLKRQFDVFRAWRLDRDSFTDPSTKTTWIKRKWTSYIHKAGVDTRINAEFCPSWRTQKCGNSKGCKARAQQKKNECVAAARHAVDLELQADIHRPWAVFKSTYDVYVEAKSAAGL